jgi:hypothetical protein
MPESSLTSLPDAEQRRASSARASPSLVAEIEGGARVALV